MNDEAINQLHGIEKLLVALIEAGHINLIELGLGVGGSADVVTGFAVGVNFVDEGFCYMGVHGGERVGGEGMGECWVWGRGVWLGEGCVVVLLYERLVDGNDYYDYYDYDY